MKFYLFNKNSKKLNNCIQGAEKQGQKEYKSKIQF